MSGIAPGPDPSMEDILASIRRILDADVSTPEGAVPDEPPLPAMQDGPADTDLADTAPGEEDDELLLDMSMLVQPPVEPEAPVVPMAPETFPYATKAPEMMTMSDEPDAAPQAAAPGLLGPEAADVTASSMMSLVRAISIDRTTGVHRGGPTIEELVREEMRPLLKDWLDNHLPPLVERLVRIEIERVVNRVAP